MSTGPARAPGARDSRKRRGAVAPFAARSSLCLCLRIQLLVSNVLSFLGVSLPVPVWFLPTCLPRPAKYRLPPFPSLVPPARDASSLFLKAHPYGAAVNTEGSPRRGTGGKGDWRRREPGSFGMGPQTRSGSGAPTAPKHGAFLHRGQECRRAQEQVQLHCRRGGEGGALRGSLAAVSQVKDARGRRPLPWRPVHERLPT